MAARRHSALPSTFAFAFALAFAFAFAARADEPPPVEESPPAEAAPAAPAAATPAVAAPTAAEQAEDEAGCADQGPKRKGVQKRDFLKRHRFELTAWGGFYAADLLSTSYTYGGAVGFWFTEDFGVEASLLVTRFDLAVERPITDTFQGAVFKPSNAFVAVANLMWSPVHLKVRWTEHAIAHGDFIFTLGGGDTFHDTAQGVTLDVGLGLKLYPTRFFTLRFDLRDYLTVQEAVSVQKLSNNLVGTFGLSFWILPWF
jgi:outer membrane beta-barrel protein